MAKCVVTFIDAKDKEGVRVSVSIHPRPKKSGPRAGELSPAQQAGLYFAKKVLAEMNKQEKEHGHEGVSREVDKAG